MDPELAALIQPASDARQLCRNACIVVSEPVFGDVVLPLPRNYVHECYGSARGRHLERQPGRFNARLAEIHRDRYTLGERSELAVDGQNWHLADSHQAERGLVSKKPRCSAMTAKTDQYHSSA